MKNKEGFLSVIVPAYNEQDNIVDCVKRVGDALSSAQRAFEILVVNDGSTDETLQRASSLSNSCDFFFDADLQYDPKDLVKMADLIGNGVDFVNGNRDYNGYGPYRTAFSKLYNRLVRLLFRMQIKDSNCGIKVLTRRAADPRSLFEYGLPLIVPLLKVRGFKSRELDVALHERKNGESKYFEDGRFLGGPKNIWDITYHSIMLLSLLAHAPLESRRQKTVRREA